HTEVAAHDVAGGRELREDGFGEVDWNREADPDRATRLRDHRGVDPDGLALGVDERAAAVARVDGRVGLDEVIVRSLADHASGRAHDARGHGLLEPERVADRHHRLADLETRGIT